MDSRRNVPRQKSFALPAVNPFMHEINLSRPDMVRVAIMSVTIAPLRFLLVFLLLVIAWMLAKLITLGMPMHSTRPVSKWRRALFQVIGMIGRVQFFVMGFMWITVKGKRASSDEARILVIAPHSSFFDALTWFSSFPMASSVSRVENIKAPFIGYLLRTQQPVLVSRSDPNSRQKTIEAIHNRATSQENWPQIAMFPEGTCTNRNALITFKAGHLYMDYEWPKQFLPVYHPNQEEMRNPKKFAQNVRRVMADALDVPSTDHTFEDCRLMYHAKSRNLPMESGLVEFSKLSKKLGMDIDGMRGLLDEFAEISRYCKDGLMGIDEFSRHLNLPITDELTALFELYDRSGSGFIDFREYVIGMSLVSQAAVTEKTVKLAFKVFDRDGDGFVSHDELDQVLKSVFGKDFEATRIYEKIDTEKTGKVDYNQFFSFAKKRPEYAKLFISYAELEQDDIENTNCTRTTVESDETQSSNITHRSRTPKMQ